MQVNTNGVTSALRAFKETCFRNRNSAIRRSSKFFKFILMSLVRLEKQLLTRHVVVYATGTQIFADKKHEISLLCSHSSLLCSFVGLRLIWWKRSWTSPSGTSPSLDEVFHTADDSLQDSKSKVWVNKRFYWSEFYKEAKLREENRDWLSNFFTRNFTSGFQVTSMSFCCFKIFNVSRHASSEKAFASKTRNSCEWSQQSK